VTDDLHCSFCRKSKDEVKQIIAGPEASICNECIQLCVRIIITDHPEWREQLDLTPLEGGSGRIS
jgi:ATP-dependent protease Clp ATPase subunit